MRITITIGLLTNYPHVFAVLGCTRTPKDKLVKLDVIKKMAIDQSDPSGDTLEPDVQPGRIINKFSRPGSSYVLSLKAMNTDGSVDQKVQYLSRYSIVRKRSYCSTSVHLAPTAVSTILLCLG